MDPKVLAVEEKLKRIRARNSSADEDSSCNCEEEPSPDAARSKKGKGHVTNDILKAWKTARPWILEHLPQLQAKGWTRKQLFQAGRYSFPHGPWGPAWSPNWLRPGVEVSIDSDGAIRWTWTDPTGKVVSQSAAPI